MKRSAGFLACLAAAGLAAAGPHLASFGTADIGVRVMRFTPFSSDPVFRISRSSRPDGSIGAAVNLQLPGSTEGFTLQVPGVLTLRNRAGAECPADLKVESVSSSGLLKIRVKTASVLGSEPHDASLGLVLVYE